MDRISRRKLLTTLSSGSALALAGCNTDSTSSETAQSTPTRTATDSPTPTDAPFTAELTDRTQNLEPVPIENEETRNTPAGGVININDPDGLDTVTALLNGRETGSTVQDGELVWETGQNWIRPGENTLQIQAKDTAGNEYTEEFSFETPEIPFLLSVEDPTGQGLETGYQTDREWDTHQVQTSEEEFQRFYDNDFKHANDYVSTNNPITAEDLFENAKSWVEKNNEYEPVQNFIYGLGEEMWKETDTIWGSGAMVKILNGCAREYSDELLDQDYHFFWTNATTGDENKDDTGYITHEQGYVVNEETGELEWLYKPRFNTVTEPGDEVRRPGETKYFDQEEWKDALGLDFEKQMKQFREGRLEPSTIHGDVIGGPFRFLDANQNDVVVSEDTARPYITRKYGKDLTEGLYDWDQEFTEQLNREGKIMTDLFNNFHKADNIFYHKTPDNNLQPVAGLKDEAFSRAKSFAYEGFEDDIVPEFGISAAELRSVLD